MKTNQRSGAFREATPVFSPIPDMIQACNKASRPATSLHTATRVRVAAKAKRQAEAIAPVRPRHPHARESRTTGTRKT